jgi:hypothetical protein
MVVRASHSYSVEVVEGDRVVVKVSPAEVVHDKLDRMAVISTTRSTTRTSLVDVELSPAKSIDHLVLAPDCSMGIVVEDLAVLPLTLSLTLELRAVGSDLTP